MTTLHHLGCESCGSTLGVREAQRLVQCTHCGSEFLALIPGFIPRFLVNPVLDGIQAQDVAKKTLANKEVDRAFAAEVKVGRAQLYWVPYYEVDGLQVSTYVEKRAAGRTDTRLTFVDFQNQGCAEELAEWGLRDLRPRVERQKTASALVPASADEMNARGHVLPVPPIPESARTPNEPIAAKYQIVASGSKLLGTELRYVYHPVWRVDVLDRIDLIVEVPAVASEQLFHTAAGEPSASVRTRVVAARAVQLARSAGPNGRLSGRALERASGLDPAAKTQLARAMDRFRLSARVIERTLRVARTIADLEGAERTSEAHIAEALAFRAPRMWAGRRAA